MEYFVRFTNQAEEDLERGTSLFKTPSMSEAEELPGLCGFLLCEEHEDMSFEDMIFRAKCIQQNTFYAGNMCIFSGYSISLNKNSEGIIFEPSEIIYED